MSVIPNIPVLSNDLKVLELVTELHPHEVTPVTNPEPKKFRFQGKAAMLTYKYHIEKGWLKLHLWDLFQSRNNEIVSIDIAHESGDKTHPYLHTHVIFELANKCDITNARFWDIKRGTETIHPHVKPFRVTEYANMRQYIAKEDP